MGSEYKPPHEKLNYKCNSQLKNVGMVLQINTAGRTAACGAASVPFGVAYQTTESPRVAGSYCQSVQIATIRHGIADVYVRDLNAISIGQPLTISAAASSGVARGTTFTLMYNAGGGSIQVLKKFQVGIALEAKASATATATVKTLLDLP